MHYEWGAAEHYRLHTVEEWPNSRRKEATLAAIYSRLVSLSWGPQVAARPLECGICLSRNNRQECERAMKG
jgi:hypothetical protein